MRYGTFVLRALVVSALMVVTTSAFARPPRVLIQSQRGVLQHQIQAWCASTAVTTNQPIAVTDANILAIANGRTAPLLPHCTSTASAQCLQEIKAACAPPAVVVAAAPVATIVPTPPVSWQTTAIQGLASFLQQRATDEVAAWLLQDIFNRFCTDTFPVGKGSVHAKDLFPKTCALSQTTIGYGISASLGAALRADIESLPIAVTIDFADAKFPGVKASVTPVLAALITAFEQIRSGVPPLEALAAWSQDAGLATACPSTAGGAAPNPTACGMRLLGTLLAWCGDALKDPNAPPDKETVDGLLGQLNAVCRNISGCTPLNPADDAALTTVLTRTQALIAIIKGWSGNSAPSADTQVSETINLVLDVMDAAVPLIVKMFPTISGITQPVDAAQDTPWSLTEEALRATAEAVAGQGAEAARDLVVLLNKVVTIDSSLKLDPALQAVISLAADLAAAKDAQGVQAALQAATAPIGSWRYKHQRAAIGLTAYVGVAGGLEMPTTGSLTANPANGFFGAFGAVGIDFTAPPCNWALGGFVSILDVGQLLTLPVNPQAGQNTGTETAKTAQAGGDINILQILSPGFYLHTSLGNTPFTLGAGISFAPLSRYYQDDATGAKSPFNMFRVNGFLAVDLNLLPFTH